ncbi:HNH endonuclease signature motif containing protein [Propionibacteriaceae bacterium Y1700]|uniref:HNH endonuclease signature motif containing protein n=1 Tax=Microlunatus sp. Y1700 TaxID=3418487 RepID=UPI003DA6F6B9
MVRDQHCQYPGCHRTRHLKVHHVISWLDGGPTDLDNLMLLCQHHHTAVHEGRLAVTRLERPVAGRTGVTRWHFARPDGSTVVPVIDGFRFPLCLPPLTHPDRSPLTGADLERVQAERARLSAVHDQQRDDLEAARDELTEHYATVTSTRDRRARSLFPVGGGAGFRLHNCVEVLFGAHKRVQQSA